MVFNLDKWSRLFLVALVVSASVEANPLRFALKQILAYRKAGCASHVISQARARNFRLTRLKRISEFDAPETREWIDESNVNMESVLDRLIQFQNHVFDLQNASKDTSPAVLENFRKQLEKAKLKEIGNPSQYAATVSDYLRANFIPHEVHAFPTMSLSITNRGGYQLDNQVRRVIRIVPSALKNNRFNPLIRELQKRNAWGVIDLETHFSSSASLASFSPQNRWVNLPLTGIFWNMRSNESYSHEVDGHLLVSSYQMAGMDLPLYGHTAGDIPKVENAINIPLGFYDSSLGHDETRAKVISLKYKLNSLLTYLLREQKVLVVSAEEPAPKMDAQDEDAEDEAMFQRVKRELQGFFLVGRVDFAYRDGIGDSLMAEFRETEADIHRSMKLQLDERARGAEHIARTSLRISELEIEAVTVGDKEPRTLFFFPQDGQVMANISLEHDDGPGMVSRIPLVELSVTDFFVTERARHRAVLLNYLQRQRQWNQHAVSVLTNIRARVEALYALPTWEAQVQLLKTLLADLSPLTDLPPLVEGRNATEFKGRYPDSVLVRSDLALAKERLARVLYRYQPKGLFSDIMAAAKEHMKADLEQQKFTVNYTTDLERDNLVRKLMTVPHWQTLSDFELFQATMDACPEGANYIADQCRTLGAAKPLPQ